MAVTEYSSTDASSPVLTGQVGSFVALLDTLLVGTTGIAYGSKASVGWTKPYSATNKGVYRQPTSGANGFYLDVDDTTTSYARVRGFEAMTAPATGTNGFPLDAQLSGGGYLIKSASTDSTARPWRAISNGKILYLVISDSETYPTFVSARLFVFGDFTSFKSGDIYNTLIMSNHGAGSTSTYGTTMSGTLSAVHQGKYIARNHVGTVGSITANTLHDHAGGNGTTIMGSGGSTYPNPIDGSIQISPVRVGESVASVIRGVLPGLWSPLHNKPLAHDDTFSGTGAMAGKTFRAINVYSAGQLFFETSNTW